MNQNQDNQNHPGSQPVIPFTGLQAIKAAEVMRKQAEGGFTLKNLEPARPGAEAPTELLETAILDKLNMDYRGLDCAGADSEASFFDALSDEFKNDKDVTSALLQVFDRYGARNGNMEMAKEYLDLVLESREAILSRFSSLVKALEEAGAFLVDMECGFRERGIADISDETYAEIERVCGVVRAALSQVKGGVK